MFRRACGASDSPGAAPAPSGGAAIPRMALTPWHPGDACTACFDAPAAPAPRRARRMQRRMTQGARGARAEAVMPRRRACAI
eukprot:982718-Pyramimonas_sp.AAC.1